MDRPRVNGLRSGNFDAGRKLPRRHDTRKSLPEEAIKLPPGSIARQSPVSA
jgi:hypothetical protein